jgi:hypothetical protein
MTSFNYVWNAEGDWEGLYADGKLVMEGHKIDITQLARYLGLDWYACEVPNVNTEECGLFPEDINLLEGVSLGRTSYE